MQHILEEYGTVAGLLLLAVAIIIFLSSPEDVFLSVTLVDTELYHKTPNEIYVNAEFDFYNTTALKEFPKNIGNWWGVGYISDEERVMKQFKTNTALLRKYYNGSRSVQFVLIKSENETLLHKPEVCYSLAGKFNITEKGTETIKLVNWSMKWAVDTADEFYVNRFYAQKENITEVVMYWYMWNVGPKRSRSVKNSVVVVVSTPIYYTESDDMYALGALKDFASEIFPVMYKPMARSESIGKQLIDKFGIFGIIIEILIIVLLLILIFYNRLSKH